MGLDISAYGKVVFLATLDDGEAWENQYDTSETIFIYPQESDHIARMPPIVVHGVYRIDGETIEFRAGSYSGYNMWRDQLSQMALGVSARIVWENWLRHRDQPFAELINFSDCEGVIGSECAARLARAFADFQPQADKIDDTYFREKYTQWRRACEIAADGGLIYFG